ncbi:MAG TPA: alpha-L-fucosidase [Bryobacteraceae bacterium]|nr:alpha-L-fucosidase [Bryobacteraceae bacterium]
MAGASAAVRAAAAEPAVPTPGQVEWQDMEVEMFLCLDPCTWQGRESDDHSTPVDRIDPDRLDTDQWAETARSMGAGQILFVAKHSGGFCWWQTRTSGYGVKETPWRGGKGDVVKDLAASCRKAGLKLALYLSPHDDMFGAGVAGRCKTPEAQAKYNEVFRAQWTELLNRYGEVSEVWFDGSSVIDVGGILARHCPDAMVFQSTRATIRWVGNEDGIAPDPCWNAVPLAAARGGVATARDGTPDGGVWLPVECDARLRSGWFWHPDNEPTLKSLEQLMRMYERSVGHGAVLLLNNAPDTSGLIPKADVRRSAEFGAEVRRRFGRSAGEARGEGDTVELRLPRAAAFDRAITAEDIRSGERVREYRIEALAAGEWKELARGTAVGHKKIDAFPLAAAERVRFRAVEAAGRPLIRKLAVYDTRTNKEEA